MIKSVIIDDQESYRKKLRNIIDSVLADKVEVLAEAGNIAEGMEIIMKHNPDLVFLDIEMPGGTGFDLLEKMGNIKFDVIFTTAHQDFAIRAIKFSALDYLVKPVDADELMKAVLKHEGKRNQSDSNRQLEVLFQNLKNMNSTSNLIGLPTMNGLTFIKLQDIVRCNSDVNYTVFYLADKSKITVSRTLKEVESMLTESNFMRVHDSHLINFSHIRKYVKGDGGIAIMSDGAEVDISRRKKEEFKKRLADLKMIL